MRSIEKKRPPIMTPQRWIMLIVAATALLALLLFSFYRSIQTPIWSEEHAASKRAAEAAGLQDINKAYKHVWDEVSWIVNGVDANGDEVYVWMTGEDEPEISYAWDAYSPDKVSSQLLADKSGAVIKHTRPGIYNGMKSWEVFYSYTDTSKHYYYDFYRFDNGELLGSYKLPARTEP